MMENIEVKFTDKKGVDRGVNFCSWQRLLPALTKVVHLNEGEAIKSLEANNEGLTIQIYKP